MKKRDRKQKLLVALLAFSVLSQQTSIMTLAEEANASTEIEIQEENPAAEAQTEAPQPETQAQTEAPQPETQVQTEAPQPETQAQTEAPQPETQAQTEAPQPETQAQTEAPQPETQAQTEAPQPETQAQTEAPQPETQAQTEAPQPETQAQTEAPQTEIQAEIPVQTEAQTEAPTESESETNTDEIIEAYEAVISLENDEAFTSVYEKPDENSKAAAQIANGSHVMVVARNNDWVKIETGSLKGYVNEKYVKEPEDETAKKHSFYLTSEIPENAGSGDIITLRCFADGYEEGTYRLQWQYRTTDWFGNFIGEWTDAAGEDNAEIKIALTEESVLRAWRVLLIEE